MKNIGAFVYLDLPLKMVVFVEIENCKLIFFEKKNRKIHVSSTSKAQKNYTTLKPCKKDKNQT